jgi:hypothetical protein
MRRRVPRRALKALVRGVRSAQVRTTSSGFLEVLCREALATAQFRPGEAPSLHRVNTGVTAGKVSQDVGEALSRHFFLSRRIVREVWGGLKK